MGVSPLQLVNVHRNRRYFVIKLHTWICLSYFLKTNITFYCIYQYLYEYQQFFSTPYLFLDTAARLQWPVRVTHFSTFDQFFLIMLFNQSITPLFHRTLFCFTNVPMNTGPIFKWTKGVILIRRLLLFPFLKLINNILSDNVHKLYIYSDNWSVNLLVMTLTALLLYLRI